MIEYDVAQGSDDWFRLRLGKPTASEFKRIMTAKGRRYSKGAAGYIDQLIGHAAHAADGRYPPRVESYTSRSMEWGAEAEAEARFWYVKETGMPIRQIGFCVTDDGRFGCSPDGLIDPDGGLELKCPQPQTQMKYLRQKEVPAEYLAQVHGALIVTGRAYWDFLSYAHGLPCLLIRTVPDDFTAALRICLEKFWSQYQETLSFLSDLAHSS